MPRKKREIQDKVKDVGMEIDPGIFNISMQLRDELSAGLKGSMLSRYQVAARMSELIGNEITKSQIDKWVAKSEESHRFPAEYLPVFCHVTGHKEPLRMMAKMVQCYLLEPEEALLAELGKIDQVKRDMARQEKMVRELINQMKRKETEQDHGAGRRSAPS